MSGCHNWFCMNSIINGKQFLFFFLSFSQQNFCFVFFAYSSSRFRSYCDGFEVNQLERNQSGFIFFFFAFLVFISKRSITSSTSNTTAGRKKNDARMVKKKSIDILSTRKLSFSLPLTTPIVSINNEKKNDTHTYTSIKTPYSWRPLFSQAIHYIFSTILSQSTAVFIYREIEPGARMRKREREWKRFYIFIGSP